MAPLTPVQREPAPPQNALGPGFMNHQQVKSSSTSVSTAATSSTIENHHSPRQQQQMQQLNQLSPRQQQQQQQMQQQQHQQYSPRNQQQQQMQHNQNSPSNTHSPQMSPNNGLHTMHQQGSSPESIQKLRASLQEATQRDATAKAALAKSDAVILELRSSIRQLKRQIEHVQKEKDVTLDNVQQLQRQLSSLEQSAAISLKDEQQHHDQQVHQLQSQLQVSETQAKEQMVGELQVQLDRAHAQILTADMVRKELEDTLEAEQYTWELRVQDQERQIMALQEECKTCQEDLEECRAQWREAEVGWNEEIVELREQSRSLNNNSNQSNNNSGSSNNNNDNGDVLGKLKLLEKEREELQGCLDEAMKELEAVDQELRQNPNVLEPLQHLYQWLLERNNLPTNNIPSDTNQLVSQVQDLIEQESQANPVKVAELEAQLSVYRGDLKAREESSAELRASLKEAVALLKPLQDAVAKTDHEKRELEHELESLRKDRELHQKQSVSPTSLSSIARSMPSGEEQQEMGGARSKRNKAQESLAKMLSSAQSRFQELHQDNGAIVEENEMLAKRVQDLERELVDARSVNGDEDSTKRDVTAEMREAAILQLEEDVRGYSAELARKEEKLEELEEQIREAQDASFSVAASEYDALKAQAEELEMELNRKRDIEQQLHSVKKDLILKAEAERMLNESLKEALGLLKPLQMHLETAEKEKRTVSKQLKSVKKKLFKLETGADAKSVQSRSDIVPDDQASDLEVIIQELEHENSQLRPQQSKLQEQLVEVQSRYSVTQDKLESATVENHALVDALKQREHEEQQMKEELAQLRKKVEKSEHELENAKYIATSALMKVEELTMANLSSTLTRDIVEHKQLNQQVSQHISQQQSPVEVHRLKQKLASLEEEVGQAHDLNDSLEESIQERDRMLLALADQQSQSPASRSKQGQQQRVKWEY